MSKRRVAKNLPDMEATPSIDLVLCIPLSPEKIEDIEQEYQRRGMVSTRDPQQCAEATGLEYSELDGAPTNVVESQVFSKRHFVDTLAKPVQGEQVPEKVSTMCWWDGHTFSGRPIGVPLSQHSVNGFKTRGIQCSPQCAAASIWNSSAPAHIKWEQQALLHKQVGWSYTASKRIRPAPERAALVEQTGPLTIAEQRELLHRDDKSHSVIYPPCVSDTPMFEVSSKDEFSVDNHKKQVPLDKERVKAAQQNINTIRNTRKAAKPQGALVASLGLKIVHRN